MGNEDALLTGEELTAEIDKWLNGEVDARHVSEAIALAQYRKMIRLGYRQPDKDAELPNCPVYRWIDIDEGEWKYDKELMAGNCPLLGAGYHVDKEEEGRG